MFSTFCCYSHLISFYLLFFFRVFPVLWKIAKIFVDARTRAKCVILKTSELHKLCDYFDTEDLPEEFGGTCRCENGCLPPVPKHMVSFDFSEELPLPKWRTPSFQGTKQFARSLANFFYSSQVSPHLDIELCLLLPPKKQLKLASALVCRYI